MTITHAWDGQQEEGTLPRPGFKYPWVYVIQESPDGLSWAVYSQGSRAHLPIAWGCEPNLDAARHAAADGAAKVRTATLRSPYPLAKDS